MKLDNSANLNIDRKPMNHQKRDDFTPESSKELRDQAPLSKKDQLSTTTPRELSPKARYLKMISKLENRIKTGKIEQKMLKKTFLALEERLVDITPRQQKKFLELQLFKKMGIKELKNINEIFVKMSEKDKTRFELFELLKNQEFISLLMSETPTPEKYSTALSNQNSADLAVV